MSWRCGWRAHLPSLDRAAASAPPFVAGWREVFVPLAIVMHNQHGPTLAVAGLAIAASRLGGWLYTKHLFRRPPHEAAIVGGLALLLLGLAPEEGPIGLLLWFVFGVTWPPLQEALAGRRPSIRAGTALLLTGMAVAGPLANGPGTWLIAGCYFFLASYLGSMQRDGQAELAEPGDEAPPSRRLTRRDALPFLFGFMPLLWIWLVPARLIDLDIAPAWFGVILAIHWTARLGGAWLARRLPTPASLVTGGLGLLLGIALIAGAPVLWMLVAGLVLAGAALGIAGSHPRVSRPELGELPDQAQALGEVLGPLAGVAIYLLGGPIALFAAAALAGLALAIARHLDPLSTSIAP